MMHNVNGPEKVRITYDVFIVSYDVIISHCCENKRMQGAMHVECKERHLYLQRNNYRGMDTPPPPNA